MGANIYIYCPVEDCDFVTGLRFDPGPENHRPTLVEEELKEEHPNHLTNARWKFIKELYK